MTLLAIVPITTVAPFPVGVQMNNNHGATPLQCWMTCDEAEAFAERLLTHAKEVRANPRPITSTP